jgi:hypothetical protein
MRRWIDGEPMGLSWQRYTKVRRGITAPLLLALGVYACRFDHRRISFCRAFELSGRNVSSFVVEPGKISSKIAATCI